MKRRLIQKRLGRENVGVREVNLTPLIDVSLVIVTMLMLTTPLSFESSVALRQSQPRSPDGAEEQFTERLELHVVSEDSLEVNGMPVARARLSDHLRPALEYCASRQVVITCEDDISHGTFVNVLDQAKICGAEAIGVRGS